ncbi:MAG: poly-gamma-glutamate biosynthesis protein PgsC/CapC [Aminivibrio sp.]|jgi:hypothetical protein|nr:capsule biosynthesis protein CapC [Synergistaceae bacterium]
MSNDAALYVALGILAGMYLFNRTGYSPGGIITPGLLAMDLADPGRLAAVFACAGVTALLLALAVRAAGVYGRQRTALAMLIAILARAALGFLFPAAPHWSGWVIPGLIGADMERQGVLPTAAASLAAAFAASMAAGLIITLSGAAL